VSVLIVAEAGMNHDGSLGNAIRMAERYVHRHVPTDAEHAEATEALESFLG